MSKRNTTTQPTMDHVPGPWVGWKSAAEGGKRACVAAVFEVAQDHVNALTSEFWRNGKRLSSEQLAFVQTMGSAADNTLQGFMYGLSGLGEVLSIAVRHEDGPPSDTALAAVGWMLQTISDTMIAAHDLQGEAQYLSALHRGATEDAE